MFELDHIFVLCEPGAPEADELVAVGLIEGRGGSHRGQGTSNRVFFFQDVYLEFLWVHDEVEARSSRTAPTQLWERWSQRQRGASSFGLCFRPSQPQFSEQKPFAGFDYRPAYFPDTYSIWLAKQPITQAMMFYLSFARPPIHSMPDAPLNRLATELIQLQLASPVFIETAHWPVKMQLENHSSEQMTLRLNGYAQRSVALSSLPLTIYY
ncbi:VOC family protein [Deefgea rivuli]|uniref:VOC family protein n=1 Tax=Deefgea rivuli TaxID=400948 RepID=UPI0006846140|nr:VOC family protein [Deefgea rivuli]